MSNQSADEMKTVNIAKMGDKLGGLYSGLWQEVAATYVFWMEYVELFGTKKERTSYSIAQRPVSSGCCKMNCGK
jgi:hypothetical protein